MIRGRSGFKMMVPDLAAYVDERTKSVSKDPSFYIELKTEEGKRAGCLVFYDPEQKSDGIDIKIGAATEGETWGRIPFSDYLLIRWLVIKTAFVELGCDHISAYIRPENHRSQKMLEMCGFALIADTVLNGVACRHYRLKD